MNSLLPHPRRSHLAAAVCTVLCAVSPWASAQLIDDVEVRRDGDDAVVAIRFVTPVRYTRNVSPRANDLTQVFYEVIDSRGVANLLQSGQRRLAGGGRDAGHAAFERGDALFQHGVGRIRNFGIDMASSFHVE